MLYRVTYNTILGDSALVYAHARTAKEAKHLARVAIMNDPQATKLAIDPSEADIKVEPILPNSSGIYWVEVFDHESPYC